MAYTFVGTDQKPWTKVNTINTNNPLSGNGAFCHQTTAVPGAIDLSTLPASGFSVEFFGKNAEGFDLCRALVRIWLLYKVTGGLVNERIGMVLCTLTVELGGGTASTGIFATGGPYNFAHKIYPTADKTLTPPGIRVMGDADDALAVMLFDSLGGSSIVIQVTNISPDSEHEATAEIGYLWRPV